MYIRETVGDMLRRQAFRKTVQGTLVKVLERRPELLDNPFGFEEAMLRVVNAVLDLPEPTKEMVALGNRS